MVKNLVKDEKGAALILALILLLVGGLITAALLNHMGSGILLGVVHERRTAELYAADAGVEDAIWWIHHQDEWEGAWPCNVGSPPAVYNITDINGKRVQISIEYIDGSTYKITSTAITDGGGDGGIAAIDSTTIVEAYIISNSVSANYSGILEQVITSQGDLNENDLEKVTIDYSEGHGPIEFYDGPWPTAGDLADWYWRDVKDGTHYDGNTAIDLEGNSCPPGHIYINGEAVNCPSGLGPLYIDGKLTVDNSVSPAATLTLNDTLYITGDTIIEPTKDLIIDLNGHTIFVASDSIKPPESKEALYIKGKCGIKGPGVIIAVGDIYFEPNIVTGDTDPVFIISIEGTTTLKPGGSFYGAIAGSVDVEVFSGANPTIVYPEEEGWYEDFNFPIGNIQNQQLIYSIYSWEIIQK